VNPAGELLEVIERETLTEVVPELIVDQTDGGGEVVDASTSELLHDTTPDLLVVEEERQTVLIDPAGPQGPPGPPGVSGGAAIVMLAGHAIGGHRAVRAFGGYAIYADNQFLADANLVLGISTGAAMLREPVTIQTAGLLTEPTWAWEPDAPVFVSQGGTLTQSPPTSGFSLIVGVAVTTTQIHIGAKSPIIVLE
jgi:hypothetical protein